MNENQNFDNDPIPNEQMHQNIPESIKLKDSTFRTHRKCFSLASFGQVSQNNRNQIEMLQLQNQIQNNFPKKDFTCYIRPYLVLDIDMDQIKSGWKPVKILPIEQVRQMSVKDWKSRKTMKKKQGISIVKQLRMKIDAKMGQIQLGGGPSDQFKPRGKGAGFS